MLKILFLGSLGDQSLITLNAILESGHTVSCVGVAGSSVGMGKTSSTRTKFIPAIIRGSRKSMLEIALERGIPVEILHPGATKNQLQPYSPDVGIVSCYPHRLQDDLLQLPKLGCFNLHPSLLPEYRGPAPLFWQLWHGETATGVTLHRMERRLDAGDIVSQSRIAVKDGASEAELSRLCATRGAALVQAALRRLEQGSLNARPQNDQVASYQGWPTEQDFQVSSDWSTRRIANFIHGTRLRGKSYAIRIGPRLFRLDSVLETSHNPLPDMDYLVEGKCLRFNCYDGCVTVRLAQ